MKSGNARHILLAATVSAFALYASNAYSEEDNNRGNDHNSSRAMEGQNGHPVMGGPGGGQGPSAHPPMGGPGDGQEPMGRPPMGGPGGGQEPMGGPPMGRGGPNGHPSNDNNN